MVLDRASLKQESKALLKTARVNPYLFTLLVLAVTLVISGISNYMNMDDEFAYLYSVQYGIDLSFLALHRAFPTLVVLFVSVVCALLNMVLEAGVSLYHLGIRRGEEMPYVTLFDGFSFAGKIILLSIVQYIFVFLWTLLFIVPGIVAAYRYRFALYNLCENPEMGVMDAIRLSKQRFFGTGRLLRAFPDMVPDRREALASLRVGLTKVTARAKAAAKQAVETGKSAMKKEDK